MIIYNSVNLTNLEKNFIENVVLGCNFPWYWQNEQTYNDEENIPEYIKPYVEFYNSSFLSHTLLKRTEDESVKHTERNRKDICSHFSFF